MLFGRMESNASFEVKTLKPVLKALFGLTCFCLAGRMIFLQFQAYFSNEDSSAVTYKEFTQDNMDLHPTFTICLFGGANGEIFRNVFNQSVARKYYKTMRGGREDREKLTLMAFEDTVIQLLPIIDIFRTKTKEGKSITYTHPRNKSTLNSSYGKLNFSTTYHDAKHVCYTKVRNLREGWLLHRETMIINAEQMMHYKYKLHFYVHQKGQLLRKLETPDFILNQVVLAEKNESFLYDLNLRISSVDVLEKRPDAVISCNPELHDEDSTWINNATNMLGCVPPFLKKFVRHSLLSTGNKTGPSCNKNQYREIKNNFYPRKNFRRWAKLYSQPCSQMTSTTIVDHKFIVQENLCKLMRVKMGKRGNDATTRCLALSVKYESIGFREIRNYRAFGLLSLWSQIGGFVGIFLGYSLLQVPALIADIIGWAKHVMNTT